MEPSIKKVSWIERLFFSRVHKKTYLSISRDVLYGRPQYPENVNDSEMVNTSVSPTNHHLTNQTREMASDEQVRD